MLGGGAFGRCWDGEGAALINGINALIKETPQSSLPLPPSEAAALRWAVCAQEAGLSRHPICWDLDLGLPGFSVCEK